MELSTMASTATTVADFYYNIKRSVTVYNQAWSYIIVAIVTGCANIKQYRRNDWSKLFAEFMTHDGVSKYVHAMLELIQCFNTASWAVYRYLFHMAMNFLWTLKSADLMLLLVSRVIRKVAHCSYICS